MKRVLWLLAFLLTVCVGSAQAATFYWKPGGAGAQTGVDEANAFATFSQVATSGLACGNTIIMMDGIYGDGTSTGQIIRSSAQGPSCPKGNEVIFKAQNERQVVMHDNGSSSSKGGVLIGTWNAPLAVSGVSGLAGWIFDGLVVRSTNNSNCTSPGCGAPFRAYSTENIHFINGICHRPNGYANTACLGFHYAKDPVIMNVEIYNFHRHGLGFGTGTINPFVHNIFCAWRDGMPVNGYPNNAGQFSQSVGGGDSCASMYPGDGGFLENGIAWSLNTIGGHFSEMNGQFSHSIEMKDLTVRGIICYQCNEGQVLYPNSRLTSGTPIQETPHDLDFENIYIERTGSIFTGIRFHDYQNINVRKATIVGTGSTLGFSAEECCSGDPTRGIDVATAGSFTFNDSIFDNNSKSWNINPLPPTWSMNNIYDVNRTGTNTPATHANITNVRTTDPGLGNCKVWRPDGSGAATNNAGAHLLWLYDHGVEQVGTGPIWDPATGKVTWARGISLDQVNDPAVHTDVLLNVQTVLNIPYPGATHGCTTFPAEYTGAAPVQSAGPFHSNFGTGSPYQINNAVINSGLGRLSVTMVLKGSGGSVGSVTGITTDGDCGDTLVELTDAAGVTAFTPGFKRTQTFTIQNPTAGTCNIVATVTGTVSSWIMIAQEHTEGGPITDASFCTALTQFPTCSVTANENDTVYDVVGVFAADTWTPGAGQTKQVDPFPSDGGTAMVIASKKTAGTSGSENIAWTGPNSDTVHAVFALQPTGGSSPPSPSAVLRINKYRFEAKLGTESGAAFLAAQDTPVKLANDGEARLRVNLEAVDAAAGDQGVALYCRRGAEAYAKADNSFNAKPVRLVGAEVNANIPASGTSTTQRFTGGTFVAGSVDRDENYTFTLPTLSVGEVTELVFVIALNPALLDPVTNNQVECLVYYSNGTPLDAATSTPTITIVPHGGSLASLDEVLEKLALLLIGMTEVKALVSRPESNFRVEHMSPDLLAIVGETCSSIKTTGRDQARVMECLH